MPSVLYFGESQRGAIMLSGPASLRHQGQCLTGPESMAPGVVVGVRCRHPAFGLRCQPAVIVVGVGGIEQNAGKRIISRIAPHIQREGLSSRPK